MRVALTAADYRSEGIVQALAEIGAVDNARFLVPRSEISRELQDTDYGSREFSARDPERNVWSFGTYDPLAT